MSPKRGVTVIVYMVKHSKKTSVCKRDRSLSGAVFASFLCILKKLLFFAPLLDGFIFLVK
jgi:hypothetical protein